LPLGRGKHDLAFWGLRLHLICTPAGLPVTWALADRKLDERQVLMAVLDHDPALTQHRPGLTIIADKGCVSRELDTCLAERGVVLLRPSYRNRAPRPGEHLLKPVRRLIESVNDTSKANSISSCTADAASTASAPASANACSP
jgi:hypothetical protein